MRSLPTGGTIEVAPSILSADFARLAEHIRTIESESAILHLDIMDGHFVPNISIGPVVVKWLRPLNDLFFDVHLMISDPMKYSEPFIKAGADGITFHMETVRDPAEMIRYLRDKGVSPAVSIKPKTPVETLADIIQDVDMVLLMTVEPGFGGQSFMPESLDRCRQLRKMLRPEQRLEVDGGIDVGTARQIAGAGADTLVAGNAIFAKNDPAGAARAIRQDGQQGWQNRSNP